MKDKIILFGLTEISAWILQAVESENQADVLAFTVNREYLQESEFFGKPVVPFEDLDSLYDMSTIRMLVTVGYVKMNDVRERIHNLCVDKGYKFYTYISTRANVDSNEIGEDTIVMPGAFIGPHVKIGKGNIINVGACISHSITMGNFNFIAGNVVFGGNAVIDDHCFVGINTTIINGVHVASYSFIGAAALINRDTKPYGVYAATATRLREGANSMDIVQKVCTIH